MDWELQKLLIGRCLHAALEQLKLDLENPDYLSRLFAKLWERAGEGCVAYGDSSFRKDDADLIEDEDEEACDLLIYRAIRYAKNLPEGDRNAAEGYYDPDDDRFTKWGQ
jgi:hypothetical protein